MCNVTYLTKIVEKLNGRIQLIVQKVSFLAIFAHFEAFLITFETQGPLRDFFFKNRRMSFFNLSEVTTSCQITDNFNGWPRRKIWTNGRTGLKTSPPPISQGLKKVVSKAVHIEVNNEL